VKRILNYIFGFYAFFVCTITTGQEGFKESEIPQWSKGVVWYQIFPERFCNGDSSNDPILEDILLAYPNNDSDAWQIHPWTSDYYAMQPYEKQNGFDISYNIQRRRYGGDLQGIINKLDYLKELGIEAIYLNPIFTAPSSHKYDAACYHHVDPTFGPDPAGDKLLVKNENFNDPKTWVWTKADLLALQLIEEVHQRGMKIIFDGVFNHMGISSPVFKDVLINQQSSKYKDWFVINEWTDTLRDKYFNYGSWFGVRELPEIKEDENGIVEEPKKYIFNITERWMSPNGKIENGIDGWRLDVAYCVKHQFWKDWRRKVKSINPQAYLTAEVIDRISELKSYLKGDEFDALMNYNFAFASSEFFIDQVHQTKVSVFDSLLSVLRNSFDPNISYMMQNLYDSHDANRVSSHIANPDIERYRFWSRYFNASKATNYDYNTGKPSIEDFEKLRLMVLFQMTYLGAPMVYYGDEAGMWGANDPDCRKPMLWPELTFQDEVLSTNGSSKITPSKVAFDQDLYNWYKKLIQIRNQNNCLKTGSFKTIVVNNEKKIYGFERQLGEEKIMVILNNSKEEQEIKIPVGEKLLVDLLDPKRKLKIKEGQIKLVIAPKTGLILKPIQ
jgi:cyclomaltodextrinase / maltogenic alpha-amylase / neopullulanase